MKRSIKFLKNNLILLNGVLYTPYLIGDLPVIFGFKYDSEKDTDGYDEWFNYKGLTYIQKK
jgi:hypothetical protein